MTEIAKRLKNLIRENNISSWFMAYGYAGLISCGPWIISISALAITNSLVKNILPIEQRDLFSTTTTYAYALSLIMTGPIQLILARFSGDLVSKKRFSELFPSALSALTLVGLIALMVGGVLFGLFTAGSFAYRFASTSLTVMVAMVITSIIFLASYRKFHLILVAFFCGYGLGSILAILSAPRYGVPGVVFSFAVGHLFILLIALWGVIHKSGWNGEKYANWSFLPLFGRLPGLALCGLLYNLGIWSDKFLFWWLSEHSVAVDGALRASPTYDLAIYLSLLSIIPGFAAMFFFMETHFTGAFHNFYSKMNKGGSLTQLNDAKWNLMETIRVGLNSILKIQGIATITLLICSSAIAAKLGIGALQQGIFSVTLIGTCILLVFLFVLTILFYLNDVTGALISTSTFFIVNTLISYFTLHTDEGWHGYGFLAASSIACLIAMVFANRACGELEYRSFQAA